MENIFYQGLGFAISAAPNKIVIKITSVRNSAEIESFFVAYEKLLLGLCEKKEPTLLFVMANKTNFNLQPKLVYQTVSGFVKLRPLSNQIITRAAALFCNNIMVKMVDKLVKKNSTEHVIPTLVSTSSCDCKKFLRRQ